MKSLKQFNEYFLSFRNAFGGNSFDIVNPDNGNLMIENECHHNVTKRQTEIGGRSVLGFNLCDRQSTIFLSHHSVWETPDGSLVDVTIDEPTMFLPVKYFDSNVEWFFCNALFEFRPNSSLFSARIGGHLAPFERPITWL